MKPFISPVVLAGVALSLPVVTGCAAGAAGVEHSEASPYAAKDVGRASGGCPTSPSLPLPKEFPADLPLPEGAVVTSVEHRSGDRLVVATVVRGGFDAALTFMQQRLPQAGYVLEEGEVEDDDAESNFSSAAVEGRWTLRTMPACERGVYLTYLTAAPS